MGYGPRSQNMYSQTAVPLDGGLDLINPKITIQAGTVSGCLNFERTDRVGYSRTLGYERFDGGMSPSLSYTNLVYVMHDTIDVFPPARDEVFRALDGGVDGPVMGCAVFSEAGQTLLAITDFNEWRLVQKAINNGDEVQLDFKGGATLTVTAIQSFNATFPDDNAEQLTNRRNSDFNMMRDEVEAPGNSTKPTIGLHGFRDLVYAVKDLNTLHFSSGTDRVYANEYIVPHGDITEDRKILVLDVHVVSGDWDSDDAAGYFLVDTGDTVVPEGSYDIARPTTGRVEDAVSIDLDSTTDAWAAGLYRAASYQQADDLSIDEGWSSVSLGYKMGYDAGQSNGPFRVARRGDFSSYSTDVMSASAFGTTGSTSDSLNGSDPVSGDTWTLVNSTDVPDALKDDQLNKFVERIINNSVNNDAYTPGNIYISDFPAFSGFSSSSSIVVKGVQIDLQVKPIPTADGIRSFSVACQPVTGDTTLQVGTSPQTQYLQVDFDNPFGNAVQALTFGGPDDLWGLSDADMKAGMDSGWGFAIQPWVQKIDNRMGRIDVISAKVTVYYTATISQYYFWNGSNDVTADITSFWHDLVDHGDWATNDADGTMQVTNVVPVGSGDRRYILDNDEIRTDPNGGGLLIATVDGDMTFNGLDTLADIEEANSRYELITENFYGQDDFEGMYGVSGAGRAFSWDGFYFTRIYTQTDDAKDIPRHITSHQFHLVLGYSAGTNLLSATGNPLDFSGINGAVEIATGDPVTGYAKMQGTTLGIFGKKTIQGLVGTSADNFSLTVLSPYEGAIEYTVCDIGKPIFCSYRGISWFDQTAAYGDFTGQRLSYLVTPFILPRLQGAVQPLNDTAVTRGPVVAIPCRTKNQYRLYFQDGYCLVMTLAGSEMQPMFTIRAEQLMSDDGTTFYGYFVPRAESSFVDSTGVERIHMSSYSEFVDLPAYYVYEFEKGWSFDGVGIPAYFITNENFYGAVFDYDNPRKFRVHGLSYGFAPLFMRVGADYDLNDNTLQNPMEVMDFSLPKAPASTLASDFVPTTTLTNGAKRGRSFSLRFMSYDTASQDSDVIDPVFSVVSPPFVVQAIMPQYTENKGDT